MKLVISKIRVKLKAHRKPATYRKYDTELLKSEAVRGQYQATIGGKFAALVDREDMDCERRWTNFKTVINETAKEVIGHRKRLHKPWVTDRSRILSERQRRVRVLIEDEPNAERKAGLREERRIAMRELHSSLKYDKNKFWEEKANELEEAGKKGESYGMFAAVRFLKREGGGQFNSSAGIRNQEGMVVTSDREKAAVFTKYFDQLYNPTVNVDRDLLMEFEGESEGEEWVSITEAEVDAALKSVKNRKAAGVCGIQPELLKYGGVEVVKEMTQLCNLIMEEKRVPEEWKKAIIVPLFKNKGSKLDCGNYRGISLISVPSKVFMRVLLNRIRPKIEEKLREEQAGFRGGRSTVDQVFALRQILEKRWEYALPVYCAFIDLEKAYDSVWREGMWKIAEYYGIPKEVVEILRSWYEGINSCVRVDGVEGDWFPIRTGLRQGCVMSPSLFNLYMDAMMRKVTEGGAAGVRVGQETVIDLDFADDVALLADAWMILVGMVMRMELVTQRFGINISARKSEVMYVGRGQGNVRAEDIQIRGQTVREVEEFTYLGSVVTADGRINQDIERRRAGARRAFGSLRQRLWSRREISLKVKMRIFNAIVLPVLLYGATAWAVTRTEENRLNALEMGMLRSIVGIRWDDFVRNVDIRERLCQPPVSLKLRRARMRWFGHVERMGDERQVKRVMNAAMEGRRPVGRPRTRWKDVLQRDLDTSGLSIEEARLECLDRDRWRGVVLASCDYNAAGS